MANTIISTIELANMSVDYLARQKSLASTLWLDVVKDAVAQNKGETVNVATPPSFTAADYSGTSYTVQNINAGTVAVTLNKDKVVPVSISQREKGASANEIEASVVIPAMDALIKIMDADILTEFTAGFTDHTAIPEASATIAQIELGLTELMEADVPTSGLNYAVSHFDASGLRQQQALYSQDVNSLNTNRTTNVAPYAGIDIFGTTAIAGSGTTVDTWLYHRTAATVAMRELNIMSGSGVEMSTANYKGAAITVSKQWNKDTQAFEWLFRALYGVKTLDGVRGIKIITDGSGD